MRSLTKKKCPSLTLLIAASLATILAGCNAAKPPTPPVTQAEGNTSAKDNHYGSHLSLEQQESDPNYLSDLTPEARALKLSQSWYQHAQNLSATSETGEVSALLRSAHTALTPLISSNCANPFNTNCLDLAQAYKRSSAALVRILAHGKWLPPDLARTRYHLSTDSITTLNQLSRWRFDLNPPQDSQRAGLGVATSACRKTVGESIVCSPLTFLFTFNQPTSAESIAAQLQVIDTYQQEVVTLENQTLPLASALTTTINTLSKSLSSTNRPTLHCLSLPTPNTNTATVILDPEIGDAPIREIIAPLLSDARIRYASTLCIYQLKAPRPPASEAKALVHSLRNMDKPFDAPAVVSTAPRTLNVTAFGQRSAQVATTLIQRLSKKRPKSSELKFNPSAALLIGATQNESDSSLNPNVVVKSFPMPCDDACLSALRYELQVPPADPHHTIDIVQTRRDFVESEIPLSPVM